VRVLEQVEERLLHLRGIEDGRLGRKRAGDAERDLQRKRLDEAGPSNRLRFGVGSLAKRA
jgi:hypothetical protein